MSDSTRVNPAATWADFQRQRPDRQEAILAILEQCKEHRMSVRCEIAGAEFVILIARGYGSPLGWLDQFRQVR